MKQIIHNTSENKRHNERVNVEMNKPKWIVTFCISVMMTLSIVLSGSAAAQETGQYTDVPKKHWAYSTIQNMSKQGIVNGYSNGTFKPNESLTREQFAKMLALALDLEPSSNQKATFSDVDVKRWSYPYIEGVKDYLQGYYGPIGKPFYKPAAIITREEVAVALVKSMKLEVNTKTGDSVVRSKFKDSDAISAGLAPYVAAAIENNLITGYEDRTFRPKGQLDRAAAATLLTRFLDSSLVPDLQDIHLDIQVASQTEVNTVVATGTIETKAKLYINNVEVSVSKDSFKHTFNLKDGEGFYEYEFKVVKPNGRYKVVTKTIERIIPAPTITATVPEKTESQRMTITGQINDRNDSDPTLYVNNSRVYPNSSGSWSYTLDLSEGQNAIKITGSNKFGKKTEITKKVTFTAAAPLITINEIVEVVFVDKITITGKVTDLNDSNPTIYINNQKRYNYNNSINETIILKEGENTIIISAENKFGKKSTITKKVNYYITPPEITVSNYEAISYKDKATITIKVTDKYDTYPTITVNDQRMYSSTITYTQSLKEGDNYIVIRAKNSKGKESVYTVMISYVKLPPTLTVSAVEETTYKNKVTITASATDIVDISPSLYLNGIYVGRSSFTQTVTLIEGINVIKIKATNAQGKSVEVEKTITYIIPPPEVTISDVPEITNSGEITITVTAVDINDNKPSIYINNASVGKSVVTQTIRLKEGENIIEIFATNNNGKKSTPIVKRIMYVIE